MTIIKSVFYGLTIWLILSACENKIKFEKDRWTIKGDLGIYPYRSQMLDDLIQNQELKGLTYKQLIDKIGEPEKGYDSDSNSIYYDIVIDYGQDIDPVYVKTLEFNLDRDSIVTDFKINEIKH